MSWLKARFSEAGTMAGIAVIAGAVQHGAATGAWGPALVSAVPAFLAIVIPDGRGNG